MLNECMSQCFHMGTLWADFRMFVEEANMAKRTLMQVKKSCTCCFCERQFHEGFKSLARIMFD